MNTKIEVTYVNGAKEVFEGIVKIQNLGGGCFVISKELQSKSSLLTVEEKTNSIYVPFSAVLRVETLHVE